MPASIVITPAGVITLILNLACDTTKLPVVGIYITPLGNVLSPDTRVDRVPLFAGGINTAGTEGPPLVTGGVTPLITTALVDGDANAPTCDVRTTAPNPGRATETPPDLDGLPPLAPDGTYCAAALTKDVKSEPDGRSTGIITLVVYNA
jgi:hypothetical protein